MGEGRDPQGGNIEVNVHSHRDDSTVHNGHGRGSQPSNPPVIHDRDFRLFERWFPWLVPTFVFANVVVFIVTMYVNDCPKNSFNGSCVASFLGRFSFQPLKENPLFGPSATTLGKMGALEVDKVVREHEGWRLLSCIWLHGGAIHVLANMLSLVFIGVRLEQEFGFVRIGILYVISGFGGSLLSALFIQSGISVGASGALFGLLGGMLSEILINWTIYANKVAALLTLIVIVLINLAVGILPHVDNFAHLGGFGSGFLLGFILLIRPQFKWISQKRSPSEFAPSVKHKHKPYQYALWLLSFVILAAGLIAGMILLFKGVNLNERCSWCHYLSCVPTSKWSCQEHKIYCETTEMGSQLNITCMSNGRSDIYPLSSTSSSDMQQLCTRLCGG
ncbi:RHOMBOID-like protein 1 [Lathyrus oleraceus]|uniref:RHOMBOID-like protein n=1 Tax=Pisum sativum TaxID=3888 RepID=A0A9D5ANH6_PEA|nr:RHOMBOID-like protein 1 [Pisum sativum]KAI5413439.1 Retinoblastoma-like protein 1 [Pisum sativum]